MSDSSDEVDKLISTRNVEEIMERRRRLLDDLGSSDTEISEPKRTRKDSRSENDSIKSDSMANNTYER